jgi:hypothetical protein
LAAPAARNEAEAARMKILYIDVSPFRRRAHREPSC